MTKWSERTAFTRGHGFDHQIVDKIFSRSWCQGSDASGSLIIKTAHQISTLLVVITKRTIFDTPTSVKVLVVPTQMSDISECKTKHFLLFICTLFKFPRSFAPLRLEQKRLFLFFKTEKVLFSKQFSVYVGRQRHYVRNKLEKFVQPGKSIKPTLQSSVSQRMYREI